MMGRENRKLPSQPPYVEALVLDQEGHLHTWNQGQVNVPVTLTYSFKGPAITQRDHGKSNFMGLLNDQITVNKLHSFGYSNPSVLSTELQKLFRYTMQKWSSVGNIKFVENDNNAQLVILEAEGHPSALATTAESLIPHCTPFIEHDNPVTPFKCYQMKTKNYLIISRDGYFHSLSNYGLASTFANGLHEMGHVLGLMHPFESEIIRDYPHTKMLSVVNYEENEYRLDQGQVISERYLVVSPSTYDIHAVQFLYGAPTHVGRGNDVYNLTAYAMHAYEFATPTTWWAQRMPTFETIWDSAGVDTLSVHGTTDDVMLNLNSGPAYRSQLNHHHIVLMGDFENIRGGSGRHNIILNKLDNVVDIRYSEKQNVITTFFPETGRDVVLGFKPRIDQLILEHDLTSTPFEYALKHTGAMNVTIASETIFIQSGTAITLNSKHFVLLAEINSQDISLHDITVKAVGKADALQQKQLLASNSVADLPWTCGGAFAYGALTTLILDMTEYTLKQKLHYSADTIKFICLTMQCSIALCSGSLTSASTSLTIAKVGDYFGLSRESKHYLHAAAYAATSYVFWTSPIGILKLGANIISACIGSFAGSKLSFFAKKGVDRVFDYVPHYSLHAHHH